MEGSLSGIQLDGIRLACWHWLGGRRVVIYATTIVQTISNKALKAKSVLEEEQEQPEPQPKKKRKKQAVPETEPKPGEEERKADTEEKPEPEDEHDPRKNTDLHF